MYRHICTMFRHIWTVLQSPVQGGWIPDAWYILLVEIPDDSHRLWVWVICWPQAHPKETPETVCIVTGCTRTGYFVCTRFILVPGLYQYIHAQIKLTLHFQSGTITLATLTSLLLTLVWRFAGRILPIWNLLDCHNLSGRLAAANVRLATPKLPLPSVNLRDVAA